MPSPDSSNAWIPIVNSSIVGIFTILGILLTQLWNSRRDLRTKDIEREAERQKLRDDLQRKTLLQLQVAIQRQARAVGAAHHQDIMAFKQTGKWGYLLGEDINQDIFNCDTKVRLLSARIIDDDLRTMIKRQTELESQLLFSKSNAEAESAMKEWSEQLEKVNDHLGEILRKLL